MPVTMLDLVTILSATGGILCWVVLWYKNKSMRVSHNHLVILIFGVALICRLAFAVWTPTFYAPDEQAHFNYVKYLYEQQSFPIQTSQTNASTHDWEYYQPPLYYLAAVPLYGLAEILPGADPRFTVRIIRLFSIVLWSINVGLTLKILQNLKIGDPFLKTFATSMVCLLPTYTFISASINNDNLLITSGGGILYLLSGHPSYRTTLLMGVLLGLAFLTKLSAIIYLIAIVAVFGVRLVKGRWPLSTSSLHCLVIVGLAALIFAPWAVRSLNVYGQIYPESIANIPTKWRSIRQALLCTQYYMKNTFWAVSGIYNNVIFWPGVGICLSYLAAIGLPYGFLNKASTVYDHLKDDRGNFVIGGALAVGLNILLVLRFGLLYNQGQGRLLFPLLVPIAILMAIGLKALGLPQYLKDAQIHTVGFFLVYDISFVIFSLTSFMYRNMAGYWYAQCV